MTQFELAVQQAKEGKLQTPTVHYGQGQIDYFQYQLATHLFNLRIMSKGMQCRGIKLKDIKAYYGLTGRTAMDCLPQFEALIDSYRNS